MSRSKGWGTGKAVGQRLQPSPLRGPTLRYGYARRMATVAPTHDTMPGFRFGVYPVVGGEQAKPVHIIRVPKFESLEAERQHRKLHHAAALRWLGYNGYNNEGAGGHVTVRDPVDPTTFWLVASESSGKTVLMRAG